MVQTTQTVYYIKIEVQIHIVFTPKQKSVLQGKITESEKIREHDADGISKREKQFVDL